MDGSWYVYIPECGDGSLYTGITDDITRRLEAMRRERQIKALHKDEKLKL